MSEIVEKAIADIRSTFETVPGHAAVGEDVWTAMAQHAEMFLATPPHLPDLEEVEVMSMCCGFLSGVLWARR